MAAITSPQFKANAAAALRDPALQRAMQHVERGFIDKRVAAIDALPEFEALRESARAIKNRTLKNLDTYLEAFEAKVNQNGGYVHWAETAADAREIVLDICRKAGARTVTKGKSMITEEIELNGFLESHGVRPVETDLGEYIIQLRGEVPSHIIAPAVHLSRDQVEAAFREAHSHLARDRVLDEPVQLLREARRGAFRRLPLAGGWTAARGLPAPAAETFMDLWAKRRAREAGRA